MSVESENKNNERMSCNASCIHFGNRRHFSSEQKPISFSLCFLVQQADFNGNLVKILIVPHKFSIAFRNLSRDSLSRTEILKFEFILTSWRWINLLSQLILYGLITLRKHSCEKKFVESKSPHSTFPPMMIEIISTSRQILNFCFRHILWNRSEN